MSAPSPTVLKTLAAGGQRADGLASVICALITEGGQLGALEDREIAGADGPRKVKAMPRAWLDRLDRAIEAGVLDHPTPARLRKVIDRILLEALAAPAEI